MKNITITLSVLTLVLITGLAQAASITTNFTAGTNATSHRVERNVDGGAFEQIAILPMPTVQQIDSTVVNNHVYCYQVIAINGSGSSAPTAPPCCHSTFLPGTPTNITCTLNP